MKNLPQHWMVVSDLDGTMLNHHNYDWQAALPVIEELKRQAIPLVLNTSKTYIETCEIRKQLGVDDPFIVENGAAVYLPKAKFLPQPAGADERDGYWQLILSEPFQYIDRMLDEINHQQQYEYVRFSQCSVQQAMELTGLSEAAAERAIKRDFSEPIIWHDSDTKLHIFEKKLQAVHLSTVQGGRFIHVKGGCDKGSAVKILLQNYQENYQENYKTIVLGDSENDLDMLSVADYSAVIASPGNAKLSNRFHPDYVSRQPAPEGWAEAIHQAMSKIKQD